MPDRIASADPTQQTGNRALTNGQFYKVPELTLGMDVMRHLRIYMVFKENTFYVTSMSKPDVLAKLDQGLAATPNNPDLLNYRCFERGLAKVNLDGALADCELSLKLRPGDSNAIDSKGFVLYQLGRYQEAVAAYDEALKISPRKAASLFIRGLAKQKLGDSAGGSGDVAAAEAIKADIKSVFDGAGIAEN